MQETVNNRESYSSNYIDILTDLIESFSVQVEDITIPYEDNQDLSIRVKHTYRELRRVVRLKNRKRTLVMLYFLGQLILNDELTV